MVEYKNIILERKDRTLIIFLNRPDKLNSLNEELLVELDKVLVEYIEKDDDMEGFVIAGKGDKAFCAGADITELAKLTSSSSLEFALKGQRLCSRIENCGKVSIAAINGFAFGGGLEIALSCSFRFIAETALVGQPEVKLAIIPGYGGTQRLLRLVGLARAAEIILSGESLNAQRAYEIGLVNKIVKKESLLEESVNFLKKIYSNGPYAVKCALRALNWGRNVDIESGLALEALLFSNTLATQDAKEGLNAFLEKRKAQFKNK
ncbi:MAG: enoyl-CoA hydratase-related protein [Planctomycetota bacterium]